MLKREGRGWAGLGREGGPNGEPLGAYRRDGDGSKSEWIANDVADVDASSSILSVVFHFAQRW